MNDEARNALAAIVQSEGRDIIGEPWRLQGLLSDRAGEYRLENSLLMSAVQEGVPDALLRSSESGSREATVERLSRQLSESRGFEYDRARWAVESWASVLGFEGRQAPMPPPGQPGYGTPPPSAPPQPGAPSWPPPGPVGQPQPSGPSSWPQPGQPQPPPQPGAPSWPTPGPAGPSSWPPAGPPQPPPQPGPSSRPPAGQPPAPRPGQWPPVGGYGQGPPPDERTVVRPVPPPNGGPPPHNRNRLLIIGGIALAVIVLVVAIVLISSSGNKGNTVSTTLPSIRTTVTSPSSTTLTTPTTTDPNLAAEAALKARVPSSYQSTCSPLADSDKRATFRSYPGITCNPNSTLSVFFYQLPNPTVMNDEYNRTATGLPTGNCDPNVSSTFRESNVYTLGSSQRGHALCYIGSDNMARMEWTDDALNTYGVIAATDSSAARQQVYQFWRDSGALNR